MLCTMTLEVVGIHDTCLEFRAFCPRLQAFVL
jgi:hypothetical protein